MRSTCPPVVLHITTLTQRFALSNSVHSMLIQPFLHPRTVLILFHTNIFPQCEPEVSLLHTTKYILNDDSQSGGKENPLLYKTKSSLPFSNEHAPGPLPEPEQSCRQNNTLILLYDQIW